MVGKLSCFLFGLLLISCNPYDQYSLTHYFIQAEVDPSTALLSANVQMVLVARREYHDSICFNLNTGLEIQALTAQELKHYDFYKSESGRLVLYIQDPVFPNDQLHISMSYSGRLAGQEVLNLDSSLLWYPSNEDTKPCTYLAKIALPGSWQIIQPEVSTGKHGKFLVQNQNPQDFIDIVFATN
ncbi:hypothetical protein ACFLTU_04100 [Bacteroidota bacterium]